MVPWLGCGWLGAPDNSIGDTSKLDTSDNEHFPRNAGTGVEMLARILGWLRPRPLSLGARGERAAARFLRRAGYKIIAHQYRNRRGEIDLIATDGRRVVFVEVKTRRSAKQEHPAEAVDLEKQRRLTRTARAYMKQYRLLDTPSRFDIVAVTWPPHTRHPTIEHFPGAFDATDE